MKCRLSSSILLLSSSLIWPQAARSAGVTIITHGLDGNIDDWVIAMAARITQYPLFFGANSTCYEIYFALSGNNHVVTWRGLAGDAPTTTDSGEILIKLDWHQLANNDYSTRQVAAAVVPVLLQTNFISELNQHAISNGLDNIGTGTVMLPIAATNAAPGIHAIYAKITGSGHTRFLDAPELIEVTSSFAPPRLDVHLGTNGGLEIGVNGTTGQVVILEGSSDLVAWQSIITNRLSANRWVYVDSQVGANTRRFYRGRLGR